MVCRRSTGRGLVASSAITRKKLEWNPTGPGHARGSRKHELFSGLDAVIPGGGQAADPRGSEPGPSGPVRERGRGTSSWIALIPKIHCFDKAVFHSEYMDNFAVR